MFNFVWPGKYILKYAFLHQTSLEFPTTGVDDDVTHINKYNKASFVIMENGS